MKKLMLVFAGVFMFGIAAVQAQDTTQVAPDQKPSVTQPAQESQSTDNYIQRDYEQVQSADVPTSLRSTLKGADYKGWENGTVYRNKTTNGYMVRINDGSRSNNYYFDKSGKRIQDPAKP